MLVYLMDLRSHPQIMARAAAQIAVFRAGGLDASALCVDRGLPGSLPAGVRGVASRGPRRLRAFFEARRLRQALTEESPDVAILRFGFATRTMLDLARRVPLMLEIHSDDTRELPPHPLIRLYAQLSSRLYRRRLLDRVRGAAFVSSDLIGLPAFADIRGPRAVISNGIPVPALPIPLPDNERPVVGYSVGYAAPWQGLDRLAGLADALPEFDFRLVAPDSSIADGIRSSRVTVTVAGNASAYRAAIEGFDVALGGLALDRKGITIASALKVRESVSLGIPTLLFSRDEDLDDVSEPTIATIARGAWEPAEITSGVRAFVLGAVGARVPDALRQRVDVTAKAQRYAGLVEEVVQSTKAVAQPTQR